MRARTALLFVILAALGVFAALNWAVFAAPTSLHLLVTRIEAPLGVIMLAVTGGLTFLYVVFLGWMETTTLLEARRYARELHAQRQIAESAEASRYAEMMGFLRTELSALRALPETASREVIARLERLEEGLRGEMERTGNTLAAYIGELEERVTRTDRPGERPSA